MKKFNQQIIQQENLNIICRIQNFQKAQNHIYLFFSVSFILKYFLSIKLHLYNKLKFYPIRMPRQITKVPECIYGNACTLFCVNPSCKKPCFICQKGVSNRGQCGLFHENCQKMSWSELDNIIYENPNTRTAQFAQLVDDMQNLFSGLIKRIKEEHMKFKIFLRTFGYSNQMMKFIKQVNNEDFDRITGNRMNNIISELFIKDQKRINNQFLFDKQYFKRIQKEINNSLNEISSIYNKNNQYQKNPEIPKTQQTIKIDSINSKITKQFDFIKSLFQQKQNVKRFKLIYRASQNNFSVEQFHRKCDNMQNTIILIQTEFGKIIGGYTSLTWNSSKKHWTTDKNFSSFIFSLSMKQKFSLNLSQFAIACNPQKGPIFGCCDICIVDKADRQYCNAEFPISYSNFKHPRCHQTNIQFIGSGNGRFRVKQWQVFQVQFQNTLKMQN